LSFRSWSNFFLQYQCRACCSYVKTLALALLRVPDQPFDLAIKYGEMPPFGPNLPSRLVTLIRSDRDLFFKGRRAESQSLGIGAFAYYRRVIEQQKSSLLGAIVKASERLGANEDQLAELRAALDKPRFSDAVRAMGSAIPERLLIRGHNPMLLLHTALSSHLHKGSDDECLEAATSIRLVLIEFSERLDEVMKDQAELDVAVSRLLSAGEIGRTGSEEED